MEDGKMMMAPSGSSGASSSTAANPVGQVVENLNYEVSQDALFDAVEAEERREWEELRNSKEWKEMITEGEGTVNAFYENLFPFWLPNVLIKELILSLNSSNSLVQAKGKRLANSAKGTKQSRKLPFSSSESDVRKRILGQGSSTVTRNFVREEEECPKTPMLSVGQQPTAALVSFFTTRTDLTELSCLEGIIGSQSIMPQLDKFTYFTQFFWSCLFLFTFYIAICNNGDGVLGISRILKLRNQLVSHRETNIRSNDPKSLEDILRKGFSTGVSICTPVYSKYPNGVTPSTYWEKGRRSL
ncbi:UNVERIFIED_CONTAM: putative ATP synthase protein YMF19 [Sesamum latifolium]|uniref:H(+)-transporting two-sector ATPase n=1 Tax=Sesamum latifolium TaxID=2727402 RepID=A0AAW2SG76_9LAMI